MLLPLAFPLGKVARNARRMRCYSKISTALPLLAQTLFPSPKRGFYKLFLSQKEKVTKRSWRACRSTAPRTSYRPKKFRPHLTQGLSVQMCCHRGISDSPNRGFFPTKRIQHNPNLISRPAPRAPYGHRRGLARGASVCAQNLSPAPSREATLSLPLTGEVARPWRDGEGG